ncbi:hypothetical protein EC99P1_00059 [Enterococcus phage EC99P1]|nr:hypothetical protein EC99P1_00059 [Enterococcus phage EC99P1]
MIGEDRREEIERSIENLRYDREVLRELYHQVDGIVPEENLSDIVFEIHLTEMKIETLRKKLPPPMSQRQLRALEEIPKAWAEVTGKKDVREVAPPNEARKLLEEANKILNSDEKHLYRTELDEAERKLAWAGRIINQRFVDNTREEALCEAGDKTLQEYADIAAGRAEPADVADYEEFPVELHHSANGDKRFEGALEDDTVAHICGTVETPKMVIEEAPRRTGKMFRSWLCKYFK